MLGKPGDGLGQEVGSDLWIGERAQLSRSGTATEESGQPVDVRPLALVDRSLAQLGIVAGEAFEQQQQQPVLLDEVVGLVDDPGELGCGVAARVSFRRGAQSRECRVDGQPAPYQLEDLPFGGVASGTTASRSASWSIA
jgi:hypothetical protein